jgi:hypothetical protein
MVKKMSNWLQGGSLSIPDPNPGTARIVISGHYKRKTDTELSKLNKEDTKH